MWTKQEQDRAFELTQPVCCRNTYGTAFPVRRAASGTWYVTCDHVVKASEQLSDIQVGGQTATGLVRGTPMGLDLALVHVASAESGGPLVGDRELALAPRTEPSPECRIPGCYRPGDPGSQQLLRDWVDATLSGERTDVFVTASRAMKGWRLDITDESLLEKGYSGAPVICARTGRVFAVAVLRSDQGRGGIAICISNLEPLLQKAMLDGLLPAPKSRALAAELRALLLDPAAAFGVEDAWSVVLQSAPAHVDLGTTRPQDLMAFCDWLLDRAPWSPLPGGARQRDALYDFLVWIEQRFDDDPARRERIRHCRQLRLDDYPDIETAPLPLPPKPMQPTLIEVVLEPLPDASHTQYAVHSYFHLQGGGDARAGPVRESGAGGRLDPHDAVQVLDLVKELTDWRVALNLDPQTCVFQFRVPMELLLHGFENWPKNALKQRLGRDYPVVVASSDRERDWDASDRCWSALRGNLANPMRTLARCCTAAGDGELSDTELDCLLEDLARTPCLVLDDPPYLSGSDALTHLRVVALIGVVALWPRSQRAGGGLCASLQSDLGGCAVDQLPFVVRDLRRPGAGQPRGADSRELVLFWDDPCRSVARPGAAGFHPGLGAGS
jgi:hypothetical protein